MINLKDANGHWVCLKEQDVIEALAQNSTTILGMTIGNIIEIKRVYEAQGGTYPITLESLRNLLLDLTE